MKLAKSFPVALVVVLLAAPHVFAAEGQSSWYVRRKDLGSDEGFFAVCLTPDGGYLCGGETGPVGGELEKYKAMVVKFDASGKEQWTKVLDGGQVRFLHASGDTYFAGVGGTIYELDPSGEVKKRIGLEGPKMAEIYGILLRSSDGGYLAWGYVPGGARLLLKYDSQGKLEWSAEVDHDLNMFTSAVQTSDGGYFAGGGMRGVIYKFDPQGKLEWSLKFPEIYDICSVAQTFDGGYIAGGDGGGVPSFTSLARMGRWSGRSPLRPTWLNSSKTAISWCS